MKAWNSVAAREAPFRNAFGRAIEPDDEPSAAISGAWPSGAVGSARAATFLRLGCSSRTASRGRAGSARRATRVTGRATTRLAGTVALRAVFGSAAFVAAFGCAFAVLAFAAVVFLAAGFTCAPGFAAGAPFLVFSSVFAI